MDPQGRDPGVSAIGNDELTISCVAGKSAIRRLDSFTRRRVANGSTGLGRIGNWASVIEIDRRISRNTQYPVLAGTSTRPMGHSIFDQFSGGVGSIM